MTALGERWVGVSLALVVPLVLVGCAAPAVSGGADAGSVVTVLAGDVECRLDRTDLAAGPTTFAVSNDGTQVTEVYVYGGADLGAVLGEVENIGPGTSRDLVVELAAGSYEVACKPGQTGDGIRTRVDVSG